MFSLLNEPVQGTSASLLTFDKSTNKWSYPSKSAIIEEDQQRRFGWAPWPMPRRLKQLTDDPNRRSSHMGGPADPETAAGASFQAELVFTPPRIPLDSITPLHSESGCVYFDAEVGHIAKICVWRS